MKNANFREKKYISYELPISYRTPKTRANDAAADVLPQKHGLHNQKCSGGLVRWFWRTGTMILKNTEKCWFFRNIYASDQSPRPYRTLQTRSDDGTSCLLPKKHGFNDERCSGGLVRWFVKWCEKCEFSKKKNTSHMSSLYPTERQKHVPTMLQLMYYRKNTGCITKNALGDRYDDFEGRVRWFWRTGTMILKNTKKCWFFRNIYASHQSPRPYRTLQTRSDDGTSCLLPKKHGFHDERCSGGLVRWFVKWCEKCQFSKKNTSRMSSLYPTERQKHVQTMLQLMYYRKNTGCITKNALGDRYDDFEGPVRWFWRTGTMILKHRQLRCVRQREQWSIFYGLSKYWNFVILMHCSHMKIM